MKPTALAPVLLRVPIAISLLHQWVCCRYTPVTNGRGKKWAKLPVCPANGKPARPNDRRTWTSFQQAANLWSRGGVDGIGFMFAASDPFVGVDLDNCRDRHTGQIDDWANKCVNRLGTYTEVSPSGTGLKCIARGKLPPGRRRSGNVEIYDTGRYFAITGHVLNGFDQITHCPAELSLLQQSLHSSPQACSTSASTAASLKSPAPLPGLDDEILRRARNARNGGKFQRLWDGDLTDVQGDQNIADLSLCRVLSFWCGPQPELIDRLFRCSRLHRPKWDKVHFADGRTYGEATIGKAIQDQAGTFFRWQRPAAMQTVNDSMTKGAI